MANLLSLGDRFENSEWLKQTGVLVTPDILADPYGQVTAEQFLKTVSNTGWVKRTTTAFEPNTTYTVSMWIWRTPYSSNMRFFYNTGAGEQYSGYFSHSATAGYWQRRWFTFTTPANITSQEIGFQITSSASATNNHYFWGFQLDQLTDPGTNGENIPAYEYDAISPIDISLSAIEAGSEFYYPVINGSSELVVTDYNLLRNGDNLSDVADWSTVPSNLTRLGNQATPQGGLHQTSTRMECRSTETAKILQIIDPLIDGQTYTISVLVAGLFDTTNLRFRFRVFFGRRTLEQAPGSSDSERDVLGAVTSNYMTVSGSWATRAFTFTAIPANIENIEVSLEILTAVTTQIDLADAQLVWGLSRLPFIYDLGLSESGSYIESTFEAYYPVINGSDELYVQDYNLLPEPHNLSDTNYWVSSPSNVVIQANASTPDHSNLTNASKVTFVPGSQNSVKYLLLPNHPEISTGKQYTFSAYVAKFDPVSVSIRLKIYFGARSVLEYPDKSVYERQLLGSVFSEFLNPAVVGDWYLLSVTFTAMELLDTTQVEVGIVGDTSLGGAIHFADLQLVRASQRLPFIYVDRPTVVRPEFIGISEADTFSSYFIPTISGDITGGYAGISGNAIDWNGIGQRFYIKEEKYPFIYQFLSPDTVKPAAAPDPFGSFTGAEFIKRSPSSPGILYNLYTPLLPGFLYTLSVYVKNAGSSVNQTVSMQVSGNSDNEPNELSDIDSYQLSDGTAISVSREFGPPPVYLSSTANSFVFDLLPDGVIDFEEPISVDARVFINWPVQLTFGTYFFRFWYCKPEATDISFNPYVGFEYTNTENNKIFKRFNDPGVPAPISNTWRLFEFTMTVPSDIKPGTMSRVGIFGAGKLVIQDPKLYKVWILTSQTETIRVGEDFSRISFTFPATNAMGKITKPSYKSGFSTPYSDDPAPIVLSLRNLSSAVSPLIVTGMQLVEGIAPTTYDTPVYPIFFVATDSIPASWDLFEPNLQYASGTIHIQVPCIIEPKTQGVGMNLGDVVYYSVDPVYLNLIKQGCGGRPLLDPYSSAESPDGTGYAIREKHGWFLSNDTTFNVLGVSGQPINTIDLDENGYPTSLPAGYYAYNLIARLTPLSWVPGAATLTQPIYGVPNYFSGIYILSWDGEGEVDFVNSHLNPGGYPITVLETTSNSIKFYADTSISFKDGDPQVNYKKQTGFYFRIKTTTPGNHVRNMVLVEERYQDLLSSGEIFYPEYLAKVQDYACLRFMHWQAINKVGTKSWDDRPKLEDATYAMSSNGVPIEIMVSLCNKVKADLWFCVPTAANDEYVTNAAELIRDTLNSDLRVYVEFSNEWWNGSFWSSRYLRGISVRDQLGDPEAVSVSWDAVQEAHARRFAQVVDIFTDVFSGSTILRTPVRLWGSPEEKKKRHRLIRTFGAMGGNLGTTRTFWKYANKYSQDLDGKPADAASPYAYWGQQIGNGLPFDTYDQLIALCYQELNNKYVNPDSSEMDHHRLMKNASGLNELGISRRGIPHTLSHTFYEGGPHLAQSGRWNNLPFFKQFAESTDSYDLAISQLSWWKDLIDQDNDENQVFCWFDHGTAVSIYGTFGISEHSTSVPYHVYFYIPRVKAFVDILQSQILFTVTRSDVEPLAFKVRWYLPGLDDTYRMEIEFDEPVGNSFNINWEEGDRQNFTQGSRRRISRIFNSRKERSALVRGGQLPKIRSVKFVEISTIPDTAFITTWVIPSDSLSATLRLQPEGDYGFVVDWGDGSTSNITLWDDVQKTHEYSSAGTYEIKISGKLSHWGAWDDEPEGNYSKLRQINNWGDVGFGTLDASFQSHQLTLIDPDTSQLTSTSFVGTFANSAVSGAVPELWAQFPTATGTDCFSGCVTATNWLDIPENWGGPS